MSFGKAGFLYALLVMTFILSGGAGAQTLSVSPADLADGHSVMEIAALDDNIWVGYEQGIYFSDNGGLSWNHYDTTNGYGRGVVTAAVVNDSALWTATYYDTVIYGYDYYINGGIYRTDPRVMAWDFIDIPGRQDAGNIIYDIDLGEEVVWTANWWAGLKKSTDGGLNWESIVPDTTLFNPMDKHHHRIFSVAVSDEIICAGSQGGLNLS
ncbi:MAG: hypothetical protein GY841_23385, partial [FCB group bacterium]|nr:hypothetical protein [FCB group bacterium]